MKSIAEYKFIINDNKLLNNMYYSLYPEVGVKISDKSTVSLFIENSNALLLRIESDSISSLRATTNTWLRLIKVSIDTFNAINKYNKIE